MSATSRIELETESRGKDLFAVPMTLEGTSVLHQMFRFRWAEWRKLPDAQRREIASEAAVALDKMEHDTAAQSALFSLLGHKGDLLLVHFRNSFDQLKAAELQIARLRLSDFLEQTTSYLSVVELGLYDSPFCGMTTRAFVIAVKLRARPVRADALAKLDELEGEAW